MQGSGPGGLQLDIPATLEIKEHDSESRVKSQSRQPSHVTQRAQWQAPAQKQILDCSGDTQTCDVMPSWLQTSERRHMRGAVERQVQAALEQHEASVNERRQRLRQLLEGEEQQLLQEIEQTKETEMERNTRMRERVQILRERKENDRQRLVSSKMEQLFRQQCEELRSIQSVMMEKQVCQERAAQVRSREEQQQQQQQKERLFHEFWEADRRAKEEHESALLQRRQRRDFEQLSVLRSQMEEAELRRQKEKELKREEGQLLLQKSQTELLQGQREKQLKLQEQERRRHQLDRDVRLKMKRLAREQQKEMELDMSILQQLLHQEAKERQEAVNTKARLWEEQQRFQRYLSEQLQRKRSEEEEAEQLVEEKLNEVWVKREEQSRLQREARRRLMDQVLEARHLQIQYKLNENLQKQAELQKEREELSRAVEETNMKEKEERSRRRQMAVAHQTDLWTQSKQQQLLRDEQRAQDLKEPQQGLILEQLYIHKKDQILPTLGSSSTKIHPFRRSRSVVTE
ncbi:cilia- and flagella-associated protein 53-like [Xenentodon cancila]